MKWVLDKNRPLCPQLCEQVCTHIALGKLKPGEKLLSVREVALAAGVNPNTVQKAFEMLEAQGILISQRGSGWYVAEDTAAATQALHSLLEQKTAAYFSAMQALGMSHADIKLYVSQWQKKTILDRKETSYE